MCKKSDEKIVHVDILTPKQVLFFGKIIEMLKNKDIKVYVTSRRYREVIQLLKLKKIYPSIVGVHGGGNLESKLMASTKRILGLTKILSKIKPKVSVSFSSPETARVSFGLGIPHLCVNDSPHAEHVAKLTIPLSQKLLTPSIIPTHVWLRLGATKEMIVKYRGLDPVVWVKGFKPNKKVLDQLKISTKKPIITVRPEETYAAYLLKNSLYKKPLYIEVVKWLLKKLKKDVVLVVLPRYTEQLKNLRKIFGKEIILAEKVVDGTSLLFYSSVFVGGGGTMNVEAALLGIPTFSFHPSRLIYVENFLIQKGLMEKILNPKTLSEKVAKTLKNLDKIKKIQRLKAENLVLKMENPAEVVVKTILSYL